MAIRKAPKTQTTDEFAIQPPSNRLIGDMPRVGIRPAIDGRRKGVRESLDGQTMAQARRVAERITSRLRHANGMPVECVIADTCIGGVAEAAMAAEKFRREGVGASLTVTPCWCYGSETMDMETGTPKAIWGFNGTERPGAVYLAAVNAAHTQKGLPAFTIYGRDVQDAGDETIPADVEEKILQFVRAGLAVATMRGKTYLSVGSVSMGIAGSIVDHDLFEDYLGMRVMTADMSEVLRRVEEKIFDPAEFTTARAWVKRFCREGRDRNRRANRSSRTRLDWEWNFVVKMTMILRDLMAGNPRLARLGFAEEALGHNAILAGFQGQRQWTDHFPNGDFPEAILNSSFDWTGIRQPYLLATENDALNGAGMLMGHLLTGTAQIFADVRTYWSPAAIRRVTGRKPPRAIEGGMIHLINSGAAALDACGLMRRDGRPVMKPWWDVTPAEAAACLAATTWPPANKEYFRGGGFSSSFGTRADMPATMSRINLVKGLGPVLQVAEGALVDVPREIYETLEARTDPTWPTHWFVPNVTGRGAFTDVYSVMNAWGANHGSICFGHVGGQMLTLASMLRIPVFMHNVDEGRVFRPAAWNSFNSGTAADGDPAACAHFGPLYGKTR